LNPKEENVAERKEYLYKNEVDT